MRARIVLPACLLVVALCGVGLFMSCGKGTGGTLAKVGAREISVQEYNDQYYEISPPHRPRQMHTMEGKRRFLEDIINKEIMAAEAERRGYADDPNILQTMKFLTDQEVLTYLREEAVDQQVSLEPGETREFYEKQDTKRHLQMLVFNDKTKAETALARVDAGTPFRDLANETVTARVYPDADAGWHTWGDFEEPLNSVAFGLEAGEISDLVEMPGPAWGIVKAVEILPNPDLKSFEEMKRRLGLRQEERGLEIVLALGEATGHAHVLVADSKDTKITLFTGVDERRFVRVEGGTATLKHEEHGPIKFKPGIHEVVNQREWSPEAPRRVVD